jgi:DNA-binding transcriptional regulator GbsR (MarR family)
MDNFLKKLTSLFHKSKSEVIKTTVIGKAMIEGSQLENKKRALLRELGELAFKLNTKGAITHKKVETLCKKINVVETKIVEGENKIDEVKADSQ